MDLGGTKTTDEGIGWGWGGAGNRYVFQVETIRGDGPETACEVRFLSFRVCLQIIIIIIIIIITIHMAP